MQQRLFKRFNHWEDPEVSSIDIAQMIESVRDDVEKLLNTRQGTVLIDDGYGLDDFSFMFNSYMAPDINQINIALIKQCRQYEPRISNLQIKANMEDSKKSSLSFQMNAKIQFNNEDIPLNFVIELNDDGSIRVGS